MSVSRRHFLHTAALTATAASLAPRTLFALQQAGASAPPTDRLAQMRAAGASAKITTQPLRGNVSVLLGSGGNIAVLPGPADPAKSDGKLCIDSGFSTSQPQVSAALDALSPGRISLLINTHWHFDHTDGNAWMHAAGAEIAAHEKTRDRLSTTQHIAAYDMTIPPSPPGALPTVLISATRTLTGNGETLKLDHYPPAHTDTDISIYFTNADILHTGDTWFNGLYPFIDYSSGGNIDGMILAAKRNLSTATAKTIIIPGHGPVGTRDQLQQFHDMLAATRETVASLKKQGRSIDEIIASKPTAPFDASFKPLGPPDAFTRLVYQGV